MKPVIEFKGYKIKQIIYTDLSDEKELANKIERTVHAGISEDRAKAVITLNVDVLDEKKKSKTSVELDGFFKVNTDQSLEKIKEYLAINGVAIVYPYLRSIVSMVTSLDSTSSIILPTIATKEPDENNNEPDENNNLV